MSFRKIYFFLRESVSAQMEQVLDSILEQWPAIDQWFLARDILIDEGYPEVADWIAITSPWLKGDCGKLTLPSLIPLQQSWTTFLGKIDSLQPTNFSGINRTYQNGLEFYAFTDAADGNTTYGGYLDIRESSQAGSWITYDKPQASSTYTGGVQFRQWPGDDRRQLAPAENVPVAMKLLTLAWFWRRLAWYATISCANKDHGLARHAFDIHFSISQRRWIRHSRKQSGIRQMQPDWLMHSVVTYDDESYDHSPEKLDVRMDGNASLRVPYDLQLPQSMQNVARGFPLDDESRQANGYLRRRNFLDLINRVFRYYGIDPSLANFNALPSEEKLRIITNEV